MVLSSWDACRSAGKVVSVEHRELRPQTERASDLLSKKQRHRSAAQDHIHAALEWYMHAWLLLIRLHAEPLEDLHMLASTDLQACLAPGTMRIQDRVVKELTNNLCAIGALCRLSASVLYCCVVGCHCNCLFCTEQQKSTRSLLNHTDAAFSRAVP